MSVGGLIDLIDEILMHLAAATMILILIVRIYCLYCCGWANMERTGQCTKWLVVVVTVELPSQARAAERWLLQLITFCELLLSGLSAVHRWT